MTLTAYRKGVTLNDNDKNNNSNDEDRVRGYVYPQEEPALVLKALSTSVGWALHPSLLVHGWDHIKNVHVYSLLGLKKHVKCYPTMTKTKGMMLFLGDPHKEDPRL